MGAGRQAYHNAKHKRQEGKKWKKRKKKKERRGFIMFVIQRFAAGCGIPCQTMSVWKFCVFVLRFAYFTHLRFSVGSNNINLRRNLYASAQSNFQVSRSRSVFCFTKVDKENKS